MFATGCDSDGSAWGGSAFRPSGFVVASGFIPDGLSGSSPLGLPFGFVASGFIPARRSNAAIGQGRRRQAATLRNHAAFVARRVRRYGTLPS
ncbi:MAG: hypothetical protein BIP78_1483 [Candidatus Bipolaricaulis sibiricus]|uniref:Uncharacterized protein n=1 Tax=Bipolaricaulis sibiricus TaxID=2501609 RepID=A0A410FVZ0_BIPS1|nr:MAG: hypothetical protein BIP78_1483 [Candidatus Bipolaricaulis sibiricus]